MASQPKVPSRFSELHLRPGMAFSAETITPVKRYPLRLIGFVENESILVKMPTIHGKSFLLPEGRVLRIRLMADNIACGFETRVIQSCRAPFLYSHLAYPQAIKAVAVRQASRVELELPVEIHELEQGTLPGEWPKQGKIIDMSSGGARIEMPNPLAAVGSDLRLDFTVVIDGVERRESVHAVVRNITEVGETAQDAAYHYGVQFLEVSDEDRIRISGYVYEQMATRR